MNLWLRFLYAIYRLYILILQPVTYGVRVLLVKDGRILLIRHTYRGGWHLPGGGIKRGETIETAARREVWEETGAEMGEVRLLGIFSNLENRSSGHNILFACEDFVVTGKPDHEIAEVRTFTQDELPAEVPSAQRRKIQEYLRGKIDSNVGAW